MSAIKRFQRGRDVTAITIIPQDVSAAGALTATSFSGFNAGGSLLGRCDGITIRNRLNSEVIMSVDDVLVNNVPITEEYSIEVREILTQKTGSGGIAASATDYEPMLPRLFNERDSGTGASKWDYFKITVTKGGKSYTIYGLKQELNDNVQGSGKQVASMTLLPVNVNFDGSGAASLAYA